MSAAAVSIVIPVHGCEHLTKRCLDLLLAQLPPRCEVLVVDDASADGTPSLLGSYGDAIRTLRLERNVGYATACNEGASAAAHETLLFLNNDVEPLRGWLDAMLGYAEEHDAASVVGAKLLDPTGAVQHAGVAIGQDGYPHNLYAGLRGDHPAVNRSRRLQAVTGACMLVRRAAFERAGGFDCAYLNSLEDVDLCLRICEAGGEVHYCHEAELIHLESASRGRDGRFERSVAAYRGRWREQARRDDLDIYAEDGLLEVEYPQRFPLRLKVSPQLAAVAGRESEIESLLERYASQSADLLAEVVRLTAMLGAEAYRSQPALGSLPAGAPAGTANGVPAGTANGVPAGTANGVPAGTANGAPAGDKTDQAARIGRRQDFLTQVDLLEQQVRDLQGQLQEEAPTALTGSGQPFTATRQLGYQREVQLVREAVMAHVPEGASVLVISRGDPELLESRAHMASHFPQANDGGYAGHHPRDSAAAVAELERLRREGAEYLVLPSTALWWLEFYAGLAQHLSSHGELVADVPQTCRIFRLSRGSNGSLAQPASPDATIAQMREYLENLIAADAHVVVLEAGDAVAASLAPLHAQRLPAGRSEDTDEQALAALRRLAQDGARYLVVPRDAEDWLASRANVASEIESRCRKVGDQRHLCRVFELNGLAA